MFGKIRFAYYAPMLAAACIALLPSQAQAVSCGTVAVPTACTLTVGSLQYTASAFSLTGVTVTGGATAPTAADLAIDLTNPAGTQAQVQISRVGGGAFPAPQNQSIAFTVPYTISVAPVGAGTAVFPNSASLSVTQTSTGNGGVLTLWSTPAVICGFPIGSGSIVCPIGPPTASTLTTSTAISLGGHSDGAASWTSFREIYDAIFTPAPPQITKAFGVPSVLVGGMTTMLFTITNPNTATTFTNVQFSDLVPIGIGIPGGNLYVTDCSGPTSSTYSAGTNAVSYTVNSLAAGASCFIRFNVTGDIPGSYTNTTSIITAVAGTVPVTGAAASAPLEVVAAQPPAISKVFNPPTIAVAGTSVITFTITNPNATLPITNLAFADTLPAGVIVSQTPTVVTTCGGTFTAVSNATSVSLTGGSIAAGGFCAVSVTVQATTPGTKVNTTGTVSGTVAGNTLTGNTASATLQVNPSEVSFLIRYAANLNVGESVVNFTNSGESSTFSFGGNLAQNGEICANVFAYSPDEQLVSCCSCNVTPNALNSLSVKADLGTNTLTPIIPSSLVIKVVATQGGTACTASSAATVNTAVLQPGLAAWGSTLHALPATGGTTAGTYGVTETPFSRGTITPAELQRMAQLCSFIRANGSGFGICKSCKVGGLGASSK